MDGRAELTTFEALARSLITAGVDVIQLRDKQLSDAELIDRGRRLVAIARGTRTLVIMNDRPDLAIEIDADGVHVGQEDVLPAEARRIVGPSRLVGVSTHSLEQALAAQAAGTDYLGVGPVFPSGTKNFAELKGVALLREVAPRIQLPAFAIGGIEATNLDEILAAGFTRVAISGAICRAADPTQAVAELRAILSDRAKPKK
jgi:thiamine-phosphate pyrophosphorylase